MTAHKITFKFQRYDHSIDRTAYNEIKHDLQELFNAHKITTLRIYNPSRNTIKILLQNEEDFNKVMTNKDHFTNKGFYPNISMALKANRTIFCSGFDITLLQTYDTDTIWGLLEEK